jgi:hypothetical protein
MAMSRAGRSVGACIFANQALLPVGTRSLVLERGLMASFCSAVGDEKVMLHSNVDVEWDISEKQRNLRSAATRVIREVQGEENANAKPMHFIGSEIAVLIRYELHVSGRISLTLSCIDSYVRGY